MYNVRTLRMEGDRSLPATKTSRFNLRATRDERSMIMRAAAAQGKKVASFVIESACQKAEQVLAEQRSFALSSAKWNAFVEALERPARRHPRLSRLLSESSVLDK
jgi:uncharacterized protein (DUF1778 family)